MWDRIDIYWACVIGNKYCDSVERHYFGNDQKKHNLVYIQALII